MVPRTIRPTPRSARLWCALATGLAISVVQAGETTDPAAGLDARAAVDQAQRDVAQARNARALWTVAEAALATARQALADGRVDLAIKQARLASEFAELGLAQKDFPLVR